MPTNKEKWDFWRRINDSRNPKMVLLSIILHGFENNFEKRYERKHKK